MRQRICSAVVMLRSRAVIMTTDADARVGTRWISVNLATIAAGADLVAGFVRADRAEHARLPIAVIQRGQLESRYEWLLAELLARTDPEAHDPWPRHRIASGASLALTLAAYRRVGGLDTHRRRRGSGSGKLDQSDRWPDASFARRAGGGLLPARWARCGGHGSDHQATRTHPRPGLRSRAGAGRQPRCVVRAGALHCVAGTSKADCGRGERWEAVAPTQPIRIEWRHGHEPFRHRMGGNRACEPGSRLSSPLAPRAARTDRPRRASGDGATSRTAAARAVAIRRSDRTRPDPAARPA